MLKNTAIEKILDYFKNHEEIFNHVIETLDEWTGILGNDRYYEMEDLNEYNCTDTHTKILTAAWMGYDEDTMDGDHHAPFCPNRAYYRSDGDAIYSTDIVDYSSFLTDDMVNMLIEHRENMVTLPCIVTDLMDSIDK